MLFSASNSGFRQYFVEQLRKVAPLKPAKDAGDEVCVLGELAAANPQPPCLQSFIDGEPMMGVSHRAAISGRRHEVATACRYEQY